MSDTQQGEGWWLASDGKWYPPESRQVLPPPPSPPGLSNRDQEAAPAGSGQRPGAGFGRPRRWLSSGLTRTVFGFFIASSLLSAITAILYFSTWGRWNDWVDGSAIDTSELVSSWNTADGALLMFYVLHIVTGVFLIVWMNLAYKAAQTRGATERKWSSRWAVGGWFIPFASAVIPKIVVNEIDRMSHLDLVEPIGATWRSKPRLSVSDWWWALYIAANTVVGGFLGVANENGGGWILALAMAFVVFAASGVLGALTIMKIGQRLARPASL